MEPAPLLQSHLAQAQALAPSSEKPGTDEALQRLKAEFATKRNAWTEKLETRTLGNEELLIGIQPTVLSLALEAASDDQRARAALKEGVTLELVMALAAERNPEVKAAYQNLRSTLRHYEQASYLEDLVSQYRAFVRELDTKVGPQSHKEMLAKTFPSPSALALKGQIVDEEAEVARLQYLETLRKAVNDAARGYFEVQHVLKALATIQENRDLFAEIQKSTRRQLEAGLATRADALKAEVTLASLEDQLRTSKHTIYHHIAEVNTMLGLPPTTEWGLLAETDLRDETPALDDVLKSALAENQGLLKARTDVGLMTTMVRMAETMVYPRASQGMSQLAPSVGAEAGPTRQMMASFPERPEINTGMADFGSNAAYIDELRVRVNQAREMLDLSTAQTQFRAKDAHYGVDVARRNFKTYQTIVPLSRQSYEATKERYSTGSAAFADFLDAGRTYLDNSRMAEEARRDLNKALIDLQDAMGRSAASILPQTLPPDLSRKGRDEPPPLPIPIMQEHPND